MIQLTDQSTRWSIRENSERAVTGFVDRFLRLAEPAGRDFERRAVRRVPFPHLVTLTPIDDAELISIGDPISVVGKQLAGRGLDFFHRDPLGFKRAVVSFDSSIGLHEQLILSLSWCRFLKPGWYDSGGRFTHVVKPQVNES